VLSAILGVLRTGAPWRDVPERFGSWSTAWNRFRRRTAAGVWARVLEVRQCTADRRGQLDWDTHDVDGTIVRAHQHAAGAVGGQRHVADKGYSYPTVRRTLARRGIRAVRSLTVATSGRTMAGIGSSTARCTATATGSRGSPTA
jgi:transposase